MFISLFYFLEIKNTTEFYVIFSIVMLPVNSVINPLLYDDGLVALFAKVVGKMTGKVRDRIREYKEQAPPPGPGVGTDQEIVAAGHNTTSSAL